MGYGLEVKNSAGDIIIDGVNKNFAFYESGSGTISGTTHRLDVTFATPTSQVPIIAIQPLDTAGAISVISYTKSGSNWTGFTVGSYLGASFNWKVYVAHPNTEAESYGLIVRDASSNIVFDSARVYFKIYQVTTGINLGFVPTATYQDITHSGISNPYYLWGSERFAYAGVYVGGHWAIRLYRTGIQKLSSTSVRVLWQVLAAAGSEEGYTGSDSLTQSLIVLK
jgi:hypothetical protein